MKKPVNLNTQVLMFFIPVVGYYAWYRIGKLWSGFFLNLALGLTVVPLFVFPTMMLYQNYLFLVIAVIGFAIKIYFLIKWSKEHNKRCEVDEEN
jgi:hypothetical protein